MAYIQFSFIAISLVLYKGGAQNITEGPTNTTVGLGGTVTLTCVVDSGSPKWRNPDNVIVSTLRDTIDSTRYKITGLASDGEFNLQIIGILDDDNGIWGCYLFGSPDPGYVDARITVKVPVSESNIAIQATEDYITINEKTTLTVSCSIENVRPQPELSWLLNNEVIDENNFTVQPDGNLDTSFNVVSNLSLMVTAEDNNKQLECRGGNFITGEYESSFKTLNVTYGPTDITFQLTNCPVLITAEINSNPPAHCIWSYDAEITTNELQLQHKEETTVTCNATNDFGWLTSKETVYSCTSGLSNNAKIGIGVGVGVGGTAVVGGIVFGIVKIVKKIQANGEAQK